MLYIFSGLPAVGKSTLARHLAEVSGATYLRIDTIEQTLKQHGIENIYDKGYQVAASIASDNLKLGKSVIADSTNPVNESRELWRNTASSVDAPFIEIEIICSNPNEHQSRAESRVTDIDGLQLPTWQEIVEREYHKWHSERVVLDTARRTIKQSKLDLLRALGVPVE